MPGFRPSFPGQPQFPGQQPAGPPRPGAPAPNVPMMIGPNGEQIFFHPHYPQLRADICKTCKHVIPIRPPKFAKELTKQELDEFMECFQMFDKDGDGTIEANERLKECPCYEAIEEHNNVNTLKKFLIHYINGVSR